MNASSVRLTHDEFVAYHKTAAGRGNVMSGGYVRTCANGKKRRRAGSNHQFLLSPTGRIYAVTRSTDPDDHRKWLYQWEQIGPDQIIDMKERSGEPWVSESDLDVDEKRPA